MIHEVFSIKECLKRRINMTLQKEPELYKLLLQVFVYGTAYIVGGFVRDALLDKQNRDIDIIVEIDKKILYEIIEDSGCSYDINRHGGIKLHLASFDVDIWTIDSNWAFEKGLVNLKESKKCRLECIAKGCFYNYDSLVVNIHDKSFDIHNYRSFLKDKELDILMSSSSYKNLNPTIEANVIRAFYTPTASLLWATMQQRPSSTACRLLRMPVSRLAPTITSRLSSMPLPPAPSTASPAPLPSTSITTPSSRLLS